jgi:3-methylcrotonyl-CoA carboxylase alpha subunit
VWPVRTNAAFILRCLQSPDFVAGSIDTGFIAEAGERLIPDDAAPDAVVTAGAKALASRSAGNDVRQVGGRLIGREEASAKPWTGAFGFRLNVGSQNRVMLTVDGEPTRAQIASPYDDLDAWVEPCGDVVLSGINDGRIFAIRGDRSDSGGAAQAHDGDILSPMPGKIIAVEVVQGQAVIKGQKLLTLEAMKMEHTLTAPFDGVVAELSAVAGAQVQVEAVLARIEAAGD